ncbi:MULTISPECIES: hypothetical protein [unclassified Variovorax]|uniref:hypothetical protein n=1 Tax=unclassified Variovorax TaxID=663243 RepID=UPI00076CD37E|nr:MULTISPECIES: hypothetical protein [unclassified Variovorax]KWT89321.1 hypothetical protein APY03_3400 [Variovorax sp. WDL1]PNG56498.1 hypothetical protein CHC07_02915 [Variovorax sp. B4]PNG57921.1 hypothetical protein CHC06_02917 [Variovorax sp. B2]VTV09616.1 hypothetical protein WDL1CHR_00709 [Variovorax sp. WDL1]
MLTPAGGIIRTNPEHVCTNCRQELRNMTRYPGPVQFRCVNRACAHCALPPIQQPARVPTGAALGLWS